MTQNRDMENFMKELHNFVDAHQDEIKDQSDLEKMADRFILEHGMLPEQMNAEPETADDYIGLAMQARTRKKRLEFLNKALETEPENVDARLMQIQCTYDNKPDEQLPEMSATSGLSLRQDRICASAFPSSRR